METSAGSSIPCEVRVQPQLTIAKTTVQVWDKGKFKHTESVQVFLRARHCAKGEGCYIKQTPLGRRGAPSQSHRRNESRGDTKKGDAKNENNRAATLPTITKCLKSRERKLLVVTVTGWSTATIRGALQGCSTKILNVSNQHLNMLELRLCRQWRLGRKFAMD